MKDRIKQIMDSLNLSQQDFATKLGISPSSLSNIFTGRSKPTNNHVQAIHKAFPSISINWLMFGEGNMLEGRAASTDVARPTGEVPGSSDNSDDNDIIDIEPSFRHDDSLSLFRNSNGGDSSNNPSGGDAAAKAAPPKVVTETKIVRPKIVEIRVFYDDQTFESFVPSEK